MCFETVFEEHYFYICPLFVRLLSLIIPYVLHAAACPSALAVKNLLRAGIALDFPRFL